MMNHCELHAILPAPNIIRRILEESIHIKATKLETWSCHSNPNTTMELARALTLSFALLNYNRTVLQPSLNLLADQQQHTIWIVRTSRIRPWTDSGPLLTIGHLWPSTVKLGFQACLKFLANTINNFPSNCRKTVLLPIQLESKTGFQ